MQIIDNEQLIKKENRQTKKELKEQKSIEETQLEMLAEIIVNIYLETYGNEIHNEEQEL
jgi:hypothetical protein